MLKALTVSIQQEQPDSNARLNITKQVFFFCISIVVEQKINSMRIAFRLGSSNKYEFYVY